MDRRAFWKIAPPLAAYVAVVAGCYFLMLRPLDGRARSLDAKCHEMEDEVVMLAERVNEPENVRRLRARTQSYLGAFERRILNSDATQMVLDELNQICRDSGVVLAVLMPDKKKEDAGDMQRRYWKVGLTGPYHNIGVFMTRLEKSRFFMGAEDLVVTPGGEETGNGAGSVAARFALYAYTWRPSSDGGSADGS